MRVKKINAYLRGKTFDQWVALMESTGLSSTQLLIDMIDQKFRIKKWVDKGYSIIAEKEGDRVAIEIR